MEVFAFWSNRNGGSGVGGKAFVTPAPIPRSCGAQVARQKSLSARLRLAVVSTSLRQLLVGFVEPLCGADDLLRARSRSAVITFSIPASSRKVI
ncbi:MAG TPA: hypothetical protein DDW52_27310 [Planctomycetaceae bacterium]|nr:hypothetical protein [Planctomycetaceae bacterium]